MPRIFKVKHPITSVAIRPVDDGYTKLFVNGEEIYHDDNDNEVIAYLLGVIQQFVPVTVEEHEWTEEYGD